VTVGPDRIELFRSRSILVMAALALGACASPGSGPGGTTVTERGASVRESGAEFREVVAGDTLYSIAWESGRDYRELADWNRISPPYTIRLGQKIRLHPPSTTPQKAVAPVAHTVRRGETLFSIATRYDVAVAELATRNNLAAPYIIKPGQTLQLTEPTERVATKPLPPKTGKAATPAAKVPQKSPAPRNANIKVSSSPVGAWTWPAEGTLLTRFNSNGAKGIDVTGKPGQPILAAAPGTVVYQGSGLRGYGQLIIVKHNTDFLSAYAHCDKIVVREGNVIKRGQKIAEMGSTGTDRVKLHFEIRYRGTPVDPLDHLPKR